MTICSSCGSSVIGDVTICTRCLRALALKVERQVRVYRASKKVDGLTTELDRDLRSAMERSK